MAVVGFSVTLISVFGGYLAQSGTALTLAFVLAVTIRGRHGGRRGAAGRMGDRGRGVDRRRPAALADTGAPRPVGPRGRCLPVTRRVAARHRGGRGSRRARRGVRRGPGRGRRLHHDLRATPFRPAGPTRHDGAFLYLVDGLSWLTDLCRPRPGAAIPAGGARAALGHGRCAAGPAPTPSTVERRLIPLRSSRHATPSSTTCAATSAPTWTRVVRPRRSSRWRTASSPRASSPTSRSR